jgi:hypothetical protein
MRKLSLAAVAAVLLAAPLAADAQLQLGARLGYSIPSGESDKGYKISDSVAAQIPITLELGYRSGNFSPGLFIDIAPGILASDRSRACDAAGVTCATLGLRFGVQGNFSFAPPTEPVSPWIGGRLAIESLAYATAIGGSSTTFGLGGWGLGLQGGVDFNSGALAIGPFVALDFAKFSTFTEDDGTGSVSGDIPSSAQTWHSWITFGAKLGLTF